jgi:MoaA/NifB/PqqE/SkfB family radical SAM enzyme
MEKEKAPIEETEKEVKMYIFNILAGTRACNARCPCCISGMTPPRGMSLKETPINWGRFDKALRYAKEWQAETEMLTGKGEPALFPRQITEYLQHTKAFEEANGFRFKTKEIQTNGILIAQKPEKFNPYLKEWKALGLDTISISIVHYEPEPNRKFYIPYQKAYIDLPGLINQLHEYGLRARLSCIFIKGMIDSPQKVVELIDFARKNNADELTIRSMSKPDRSENEAIYKWVEENEISLEQKKQITAKIWRIGKPVRPYPWGAVVFDINGQNVCLTNCISPDDLPGTHRLIVFFPQGDIATGWTADAALLP